MSLFQEIADCETKGIAVALCNIISAEGSTPRHAGSKMLVYPDRHLSGTIGGGELEQLIIQNAVDCLNDGISRRVFYDYSGKLDSGECTSNGKVEVLIEPILSKATLVIIGGGHVGQKVVHLAKWLGYRVILSDERPEFCSPELVPGADEYLCCKISDISEKININASTYFILTTPNADVDIEGLPSLLASEGAYIGVIGSKRRWDSTRKGLQGKGLSPDQISRVKTPIGLDLHAETPQEIAVSILSEIILLVNSKKN